MNEPEPLGKSVQIHISGCPSRDPVWKSSFPPTALVLPGTFIRPNNRYFGNRQRFRHYQLGIKARKRPVGRPFQDPVQRYTLPSTWKWKQEWQHGMPLSPHCGTPHLPWKVISEEPHFWKPSVKLGTEQQAPAWGATKYNIREQVPAWGDNAILFDEEVQTSHQHFQQENG